MFERRSERKTTTLTEEKEFVSPYSLDLAPSNYYLFPNLKKRLGGKKFGGKEEVKFANEYFEALDESDYKNGIIALEHR